MMRVGLARVPSCLAYERAVQLFAQSLKLHGDQPEVADCLAEIPEAAPAPSAG